MAGKSYHFRLGLSVPGSLDGDVEVKVRSVDPILALRTAGPGAIAEFAALHAVSEADLEITEIRKTGTGQERRFYADGVYPEASGGGLWGDHVMAVDAEDAELQARFQMAFNLVGECAPADELGSLLSIMDDVRIEAVGEEPVTKEESLGLLRRLLEAHDSGRIDLAGMREEVFEVLAGVGVARLRLEEAAAPGA